MDNPSMVKEHPDFERRSQIQLAWRCGFCGTRLAPDADGIVACGCSTPNVRLVEVCKACGLEVDLEFTLQRWEVCAPCYVEHLNVFQREGALSYGGREVTERVTVESVRGWERSQRLA